MEFNKFLRRATRLESIFEFWIGFMLNVEYFKFLSYALIWTLWEAFIHRIHRVLAYVCNVVVLEKVSFENSYVVFE